MLKRLALTALVTLAVAACSGDSTGPEAPEPTASGTYQLESVNGVALPTLLSNGVSSFTVTSGTLTLEENGRFSHVIEFDGVPALTGSGNWLLDAGRVTLDYDQDDFGVEFGDFAEDQITIEGNLELRYRK